jgi:hypothetical protein
MAWLCSRFVLLALLTLVACSNDNRPAAPAECQAPFALLTPWWDDSTAASNDDLACSSPWRILDRLQASNGTVYYSTDEVICAVDAAGIRELAAVPNMTSDFVEDFWIDAGQLFFTDGHGLYSVPLAGGDVTTRAYISVILEGRYAFDGRYLYWGADDERYVHRTQTDEGALGDVAEVPRGVLRGLGIAGDRLDILWSAEGQKQLLQRMQLSTRTVQSLEVPYQASILASTADFTYLMYAKGEPPQDGYSEDQLSFSRIKPDGTVSAAWTGHVPDFYAGGAAVYGDTVYAGGRLRYHGGQGFLGVTALPIGSTAGKVIGCSPARMESDKILPHISGVAADENYVYAIVNQRTNASDVWNRYAIARFLRQ